MSIPSILFPHTLRVLSGVEAPEEEDFAGDLPTEEGPASCWCRDVVVVVVGVEAELKRERGNRVYGDLSSDVVSGEERAASFRS